MTDNMVKLVTEENARLAREVDDIADVLIHAGVPCPRSQPLSASVRAVLDELARTNRMLAHAVIVHGEEGTIAFREDLVGTSAEQKIRVYVNRERGLVVMSRVDTTAHTEVQLICPHCNHETSSLLPVCLQCGESISIERRASWRSENLAGADALADRGRKVLREFSKNAPGADRDTCNAD